MNRTGRQDAEKYWNSAKVLQVWQGQILTTDEQILYLSPAEISDGFKRIYIGEIDGQYYFAINKEISDGKTLREIFPTLSETDLEIAVTSLALMNWHETHIKCSRCGADTEIIENGWVRKCVVDGAQHFPRTDPAVIVAVQDNEGRLCLGRQESWPEGRYSNFAGFVEPGESLEDAVIREVAEESGLQVNRIKYLSSQPWPFPNSIMVAFEAFTDNPEDARPDGEEIVDLKWFSKSELKDSVASGIVKLPPITSVSGKMIEGWLNG